MIVNHGKKQDTYYIRSTVDGKRKKINLGHDYDIALEKYEEIVNTGSLIPKKLEQVWDHYRKTDFLDRPISTQKDYERCWNMIKNVLGPVPMISIKPMHIKQYITARTGKVRANREKAIISILFNHSREHGFFDGANPCAGIKGNKEYGRDKYIEKWEFEEIYNCGDAELQDAMDLMLYTGQRVSDVLKMKRSDIKDDVLSIKTGKTQARIGIIIEGEFKQTIDRLLNKQSKITSLYLVSNDKGQKVALSTLEDKFGKARKLAGYKPFEIQMRDIRAKNASDDTLEQANIRLTHTTTNMTDKYRRKRKGAVVRPLSKLI